MAGNATHLARPSWRERMDQTSASRRHVLLVLVILRESHRMMAHGLDFFNIFASSIFGINRSQQK